MSDKHPTFHEVFTDDPPSAICLILSEHNLPRMRGLLLSDCFVSMRSGCTIRQLLCDQFLFHPEYVEKEISVLFLNSQPVDDIDCAMIEDGSTLALSAVMPGLVGAVMRKEGLTWMRTGITYRALTKQSQGGDAILHLKLFNRVMTDWGDQILARGVYVKGGTLAAYLAPLPDKFWEGWLQIMLKGERVSKGRLREALSSSEGWVFLTITADKQATFSESFRRE